MSDREEEQVAITAYDEEEEYGEELEEYEADPNAPMIDDEAGEILDRLWKESVVAERRATHSQYMNAQIRRAFGKGG